MQMLTQHNAVGSVNIWLLYIKYCGYVLWHPSGVHRWVTRFKGCALAKANKTTSEETTKHVRKLVLIACRYVVHNCQRITRG